MSGDQGNSKVAPPAAVISQSLRDHAVDCMGLFSRAASRREVGLARGDVCVDSFDVRQHDGNERRR